MISPDVKEIIADMATLFIILAACTLSYCLFLVKLDDWILNGSLKKAPLQGTLILLYFVYLGMALFVWYLLA